MCSIVYKASNGKEFSSEEECKEYEELPRVYLAINSSHGGRSFDGVFLTKPEADAFVAHKNRLCDPFDGVWVYQEIIIGRYKQGQKIPLSDPYIVDKETHKSLWEKLKEKVLG